MHATARDYARFGEFLRNRGVANGQRLLPETWLRFMLTPSKNDAGYGGHIWLNRKRPAGVTPALRSEEHTSELQSLMRISYAVFCLTKKNTKHRCRLLIAPINKITIRPLYYHIRQHRD